MILWTLSFITMARELNVIYLATRILSLRKITNLLVIGQIVFQLMIADAD